MVAIIFLVNNGGFGSWHALTFGGEDGSDIVQGDRFSIDLKQMLSFNLLVGEELSVKLVKFVHGDRCGYVLSPSRTIGARLQALPSPHVRWQ